MVLDPLAVAEAECPALPVPVRVETVFVRNVGTKNRILSDNHVIKKRAQSAVRK